MTIYPFAVVPSPGMYKDGQVQAYSLHRTRSAAVREAKEATSRYQDFMSPHGETGGYYYAAKWGREGRYFWADMPPERLATKGGAPCLAT